MQPEGELFPLNIIRNETVLSRFPIHNLSKKGNLDVQIRQTNENGELELRWEVSYNTRYGEPRQLAYKLDTIIINRRIEEAGRPLPRTIRLGSLAEICRELGLADSGRNRELVKKALMQNVGALVNAKLKYKGVDSKERRLEAAFQRYSVVFTGETLPDGKKADAVYLVLNDIYRDVLNTASFRPLSYDYLKALSPAAQRWYEVISYPMFATNKYKLPTTDITYSEYCMYSGQERYFTWDKVKKQMYKLHQPHLKSGYITGFAREVTSDREGNPDWNLKYTPGERAKAEYQTFSSAKRSESVKTVDVAAETVAGEMPQPKPLQQPQDPVPQLEEQAPTLPAEQKHLIKELVERFSIHEDTATELVTTKLERVKFQLEVYPYRQRSRIKDPAAYFIKAIERNYTPPSDYKEQKAKKEREEAAAKGKALEDACRSHQKAHQATWIDYLKGKEEEIRSLHHEAYRAFNEWLEIKRRHAVSSSRPDIARLQTQCFEKEDNQLALFVEFFAQHHDCRLLSFWQWDEALNPNKFTAPTDSK